MHEPIPYTKSIHAYPQLPILPLIMGVQLGLAGMLAYSQHSKMQPLTQLSSKSCRRRRVCCQERGWYGGCVNLERNSSTQGHARSSCNKEILSEIRMHSAMSQHGGARAYRAHIIYQHMYKVPAVQLYVQLPILSTVIIMPTRAPPRTCTRRLTSFNYLKLYL